MNQSDKKEFELIHLWAETKLNTQFRENTTKWRGVIGTGFMALFIKHIWDMFKT